MLSANFYPLVPQQPSTAWLHCGARSECKFKERLRPTYLSVFCSPAENSSKVILQLQVPHRERAACGLLLPLWARGRLLSALPQARLLLHPPPPRGPPLSPRLLSGPSPRLAQS